MIRLENDIQRFFPLCYFNNKQISIKIYINTYIQLNPLGVLAVKLV
jgi:hypothetical protein